MLRSILQSLRLSCGSRRCAPDSAPAVDERGLACAVAESTLLAAKARQPEVGNAGFEVALTHMAHAVCVFDAGQRLIVCNQKYAELYGLSSDETQPGTPLRAILEARVASGNCPENADGYVRQRLKEVSRCEAYSVEDRLRDGRIIAIDHQPVDGGGWVAVHQDVTTHKQLERELWQRTDAMTQSNARFAAALAHMSQGLCMFDAEQRIVVINDRYREIYELPEHLVRPGIALNDILEYRAEHGNFRGIEPSEYLRSQLDHPIEIQELGNGRIVTILRHKMADGGWVTTHEDVTERRRNELRVAFMAHHDPLTGLLNRAALLEQIAAACNRLRRDEKVGVLMLDLDRFKPVNDSFGHHAGDTLLKLVGDRLRVSLRGGDALARLGGDEFAIVLTEHVDHAAAQALAARIIGGLAEPFHLGDTEVTIGTSIGIAIAPDHASSADELLKMADLALYHAKAHGRNDYAMFEPQMSTAVSERGLVERDLRRALLNDEFELHFQPILDVKTGATVAVEALLRWRHPQRPELILPDEFLPAAEECGLIVKIGEWVLQAGCAAAAKWPIGTKLAINLSALQLLNNNFLDVLLCVLVETGLPPERLELEIRETALIENGPECVALLHRLKSLGVTIALDDFGTGYSSLSQLAIFPFDKIKIDKSFTQNMTRRADCAAIISAVLALAQSLDIATTAEGVETREQLKLVSMAGVSSVQGFFIQRPVPANELDLDVRARLSDEIEHAA